MVPVEREQRLKGIAVAGEVPGEAFQYDRGLPGVDAAVPVVSALLEVALGCREVGLFDEAFDGEGITLAGRGLYISVTGFGVERLDPYCGQIIL